MAAPGKDLEFVTVEFKGEELLVKEKFKVWKFMKILERSPIEAIDMILDEGSVEILDELEFTIPELKQLLADLVDALGLNDLKN